MTQTNNQTRKSFDELYNEYSAMSIPEQLTNLKELGRDFVSKLDKIIDQLDIVLKDDSVGENDTEGKKFPEETVTKG